MMMRGDDMSKRATIYFDSDIHKALRMKAASTDTSVSDLVNRAVRQALEEDREDLKVIDERVAEPAITYEALLADLKAHGKL
jgi:predicted transcriptional regulator